MDNLDLHKIPLWKAWVISVRPKTLVAAFGPLIISLAYSINAVNYFIDTSLPWGRIIIIWIACFILQIACNLTNDYYDYLQGADDKNRIGPKRMLQQGVISKEIIARNLIILYSLFFILALLISIKISWTILPLALVSMAVAFSYTGGKYPLSYYGLGDFFAFWFFGPILTMIIIYITSIGFFNYNVFIAFILGLGPGFYSLTLMNINNIRDLEQDRAKNKKTLALFLGKKISLWLMVTYFILAMLIPILVAEYYEKNFYPILILFMIPTLIFIYKVFHTQTINFNHLLGFTSAVYLFQTISFSLIWLCS